MKIITNIVRWFIDRIIPFASTKAMCYVRVSSKNIHCEAINPPLDTLTPGKSGTIKMKDGRIRKFTLLYIDTKPEALGMDWKWYVLRVE